MHFLAASLAILNTAIFILLASLHIYWALGGKRGADVIIPDVDGKKAFAPGKLITLLVASGLLLFSAISLSNTGFFNTWITPLFTRFGMWAISIIFLLRAVGDFNLIGFTKKVRNTNFANYDSRLYSPLCLYLGTSNLLIIYLI
jgi:hypothetical protein